MTAARNAGSAARRHVARPLANLSLRAPRGTSLTATSFLVSSPSDKLDTRETTIFLILLFRLIYKFVGESGVAGRRSQRPKTATLWRDQPHTEEL